MLHTFKKKLQMRGRVEMCLENKPLEWAVEQSLISVSGQDWKMSPSWRTTYHKEWMLCNDLNDIQSCCQEYLFGLQWVVDYYTAQKPISTLWYYARLLPPLWQDLHEYLEAKKTPSFAEQLYADIQPEEQLAMVLPLESWHLLRKKSLRSLPARYPQYWPIQFGFFSAGRTRLWECEPLLPPLPYEKVRGNL